MCLITEQKKPIILEKDLVVYKLFEKHYKYIGIKKKRIKGHFSFHKGFEYTLNKLYETKIQTGNYFQYADSLASGFYIFEDNLKNYTEGFHFYCTKVRIGRSSQNPNNYVVRCIVPKGSEVYYDRSGLGIANKIIIEKIVRRPLPKKQIK